MIPTSLSPLWTAARAWARAKGRPFDAGSDWSTTVQPLRPAGQALSASGTAGISLGAGGCVPVWVGTLVAGVVVVSVVSPNGAVVAGGAPTGLVPVTYPARFSSCETKAAAPMPASAAITRASNDGQTQSPGYQPTRLRHALPSLGTTPLASDGS